MFTNRIYKNEHLLEVNCGFHFIDEQQNWDSTCFGIFYDKIKVLGFTDKVERKGIQITIGDGQDIKSKIASQETEDQFIFKNPIKNNAIILSKNRVSFHSVKYNGWDNFSREFIKPMFNKYRELNLGYGRFRCNVVYLNRFNFENNNKISDYLKCLNDLEIDDYVEVDSKFQRIFKIDNGILLLLRGNLIIEQTLDKRFIHLECGSFLDAKDINNDTILDIIDSCHLPVRDLFENSITDSLKQSL